ncbi:unnamed protein product, partial [Linum tenue]
QNRDKVPEEAEGEETYIRIDNDDLVSSATGDLKKKPRILLQLPNLRIYHLPASLSESLAGVGEGGGIELRRGKIKEAEMLGFGGRYYWGRRGGVKREGIVVVFAWMSSQDRHVNSYVDLYSSLGWDSLVCHSQFLNMFFPDKAESLAFELLNELIEELKTGPCPLVLAPFSGGPKACMYKVLQASSETFAQLRMDDCRLVRDCLSGHIYDSCPVDFTSDLGRRFVVHPSVLKTSNPPRMLTWIASGISNSLDALFLSRFEAHRAEYWQTLYSSVNIGAPYLLFCSEKDDLAPYTVIRNFAGRLQELGGDVKLVTMNGSPHVGHYRLHPVDYKNAITELLGKAAAVYSKRIRRLEGERMGLDGTHEDINDPMSDLRKAAAGSSTNQSSRGANIAPLADHMLMQTSEEYYDQGRDVGSTMQDQRKEGLIRVRGGPPTINAHGVLGQVLFDVCVPKYVEDWDIKSSSASLSKHPYTSTRRHTTFNPMKCMRRSRL